MKILCCCLAFIALSTSAIADEVIEARMINRPDGSDVKYYLIRADENDRSGVLLLINQGSDCNSILNNKAVFTDLRNIWPNADLLLIEKYGIDQSLPFSSDVERTDCPREYILNDSPEQRIADIERVLEVVRSNNHYPDLILLGGSEGAVITNLLASRLDQVTAAIAFNGGGRWFLDDVVHSIESGTDLPEEAAAEIEGFKGFSEHILNSTPVDLAVSGHGYSWWYQMLKIDQLAELQKIEVPLLLVQSGKDASVSALKVDEMILALHKQGKDNIDYRVYEELDHTFKDADGSSQLSRVVLDMQAWLKNKLRGS